MQKRIAVNGVLASGFIFYGPFDLLIEGRGWCDAHNPHDWQLVPLHDPSTLEETTEVK